MDERFKWLDADTLRIGVCSNRNDGAWATVYDVVYDSQGWIVRETDELIGEAF
jgi:hypothetical protein